MPLTVIAGRVRPVKFIGVSPTARSKWVPDSTLRLPSNGRAWENFGQSPKPATAPPAARPWTKRRRDRRTSAPGGELKVSDVIGETPHGLSAGGGCRQQLHAVLPRLTAHTGIARRRAAQALNLLEVGSDAEGRESHAAP